MLEAKIMDGTAVREIHLNSECLVPQEIQDELTEIILVYAMEKSLTMKNIEETMEMVRKHYKNNAVLS